MAAVGTVTVSERGNATSDIINRPVRTYTFNWTCSAGGAVSGIPSAAPVTGLPVIISGVILRATFIPGTDDAEPDNGYSAQLLDSAGIDVLAGNGSSLANNANSTIVPGNEMAGDTLTALAPFVVDEPLTLVIASAGDATSGTLVLYVR